MPKPIVAIVPYEKPGHSVRQAIRQSQGLGGLTRGSKVFIKPNIVFWSATGPFPKWGVITTSRVVEDMVLALKDHGIDDITIGEGMVAHQRDPQAPAHAFEYLGKCSMDLSTLEFTGMPIDKVCHAHAHGYEYAQDADGSWLPVPLMAEGIRGVSYPKYDTTMCTYCSRVNGLTLSAIRTAWKAREGRPWDRIEILTGKRMQPTPGMHKTILIGQCMVNAHKKNPEIREMIPVKGCPLQPMDICKALRQAGIEAKREIFEKADDRPALLMKRYHHRPMFDETFYRIAQV